MAITSDLLSNFKESLGDRVIAPDDAEYEHLIERWSEAAVKRAGAVILPTSAEDVQTAVLLATEHKIPFVVACGRHSTGASSSVDEHGVVIDLRRLRKVTIDSTTKTITAEGGCVWQDIDEAAAKYGLATVGGTVNHTGIGGLTLGGGYGWLSGRYGLAVDVLLSVKLVLADGRLVTASESENPDLFWAIRGCGSAFGVAVEFTYQGYEQGTVWAGLLFFTPDKLTDVVKFANKFDKSNTGDQAMVFGFTIPPPIGSPIILTAVFYNGVEQDAKSFFADLIALEPFVNTTSTLPYEKLNSMLNEAGAFGGRKSGGASAVKLPLDPTWVQEIFDGFTGYTTSQEGAGESAILFELLPYQKICEKAQDATAHGNRGEYYNVGTLFKWYKPELDSQMRAYSRKLHAKIREEGGTSVLSGVGAYSNYVDYPSTPEKIFGTNTKRLVELKRKWDPHNVFFRWHNLLPEGI